MKKEKSGEMKALRQEQFPSGNPDLVRTNAIPRCEDYDLTGYEAGTKGEFTAKVEGRGNCIRKDRKS